MPRKQKKLKRNRDKPWSRSMRSPHTFRRLNKVPYTINNSNSKRMNTKQNIPTTTITRDIRKMDEKTGNIYETVVIISKRANQISAAIKEELSSKLAEFASSTDNLEEVFENRE